MANVIRKDIVQILVETNVKSLTKLQTEIKDLKKQLTGDMGKDAMDDLKDGAKQATKPVKNLREEAKKLAEKLADVGKKAATTAFNGLKKIAGLSFKALIGGISAAATAIGGLVAKSVSAYANYEQLIGGVETLFKNSSGVVEKYANNAYKTAGLSANEYMETVTGFSASLLQSLGGDTNKAAKYADMAISDMADNANKMGTDMASLQTTYQGFAKQNYTMLDNLKLGYGGTKEEMKRLIKDAAKLDKSVKANDMSFGNIVKAIHAVQVELDIYKTTQNEAEKTISGSLASMKSAWGNLLPALIKGGDSFDQCVDNLVSTVKIFAKNIKPAILKALNGVGTLIDELVPMIEENLPTLINELLPPLIKAAVALLAGLIKALPSIVKALAKEVPNILSTLTEAIADAFNLKLPLKKFNDDFNKFGNSLKQHAGTITKIIPVILALVGAFKLFKGISSIKSLFGGLKGAGGTSENSNPVSGITNIFKGLAKTKPTTILKGMANLAIILGGMTILAAAIMAISPYMAKLTDFKSLIELVSTIAILGAVGTALAKFAQIVGKIPVATVAKGLANMAIMIAGMSALLLLVGAVSLINFDYDKIFKITKIIGALGTVGSALSLFAGIIGMIPIPVVLAGLANIALVLAGMTAIIVAFGALNKIDGFDEFIKSGGKILSTIAGVIGEIAGAFVGGIGAGITDGLPKIGENIAEFAKKIKPLFALFKGVDMTGVGNFFSAFGSFMLKMTGNKILSFFTSDTNFSKLGKELSSFATKSKDFFTIVAKIPETGFSNAKKLFDCLANASGLPKEGGIFGWFTGKVNYDSLAKGLGKLSSENVTKFFNTVSTLKQAGFDNAKALFDSLSGIGKLSGDGIENLGSIAKGLGSFDEKTKSFFTQVNGLNINNLNGLWESLKNSGTVTANVSKIVDSNINDIVKKISKLPIKMGEGLKKSGKSLADALVSVWKDAVKASAAPVNKVLEAANWILKEFGSEKRVTKWVPYAKGTDGHKGGNALVNDGRGAELVQMPNGRTFIPQGRNVFIPNAPKGMKVLPADQTARLMGKKSSTFRYANGIGNIDLWSYMDNANGLVNKISESINYSNMSGLSLHIGKGMVSTITSKMSAWVDKIFDEFGAKSLADYVASKGVEQWRTTVVRALKMEGLYSAANVERTLFQMQTESGGNPRAINLWDSNAKKGTPSKGLMQVIDPTFNSYARAGYNSNIYDPLSNILASVRYARARYGSLSKAYQGHGYSKGVGTVEMPERSVNLSYTPEGDVGSFMSRSHTEYNSYSPQFNLTISGTSDDRAMARKVKRWINESIEETFSSFSSKNPKLREV